MHIQTLNDTIHWVIDFNYTQVNSFSGLNTWLVLGAFVAGVVLSPLISAVIKKM